MPRRAGKLSLGLGWRYVLRSHGSLELVVEIGGRKESKMAAKPQVVTLVPIKKMDRAIKFYTKSIGCRLAMRGEGDMKDGWASLKLGTAEFWLISPEKQEKRKLAYNELVVKNIKSFVKGLQKKGVKFEKAEDMGEGSKIDGPIASAMWGSSAFFQDSEGNMLMVWENGKGM